MLGAWKHLQAPSPTCVVTYADSLAEISARPSARHRHTVSLGPVGSFTVGVTRFLESKEGRTCPTQVRLGDSPT